MANDGIDFDIRGLVEAQRSLSRIGAEAVADGKELNKDAAKIIAERAEKLVPVRSGRLRGNIRYTGQKRAGVVRSGSKAVPYAGVIHYGWAGRPRGKWGAGRGPRGGPVRANPFLTDALDDRFREVLDVYKDGLDKIIRKHNR